MPPARETSKNSMPDYVPNPPIIRLACMNCDREDFDMSTLQKALDEGWRDISEAYETSQSGWWTHLGYCPECQDEVNQQRSRLDD